MNSQLIWQFIAIFAAAYLGTRLLTPLNIRFSQKAGILANPNERSIHTEPIPTAGGLSFGLVIILLQFILGLLFLNSGFGISLIKLGGISLLLLALGLFDDKYKCRVRYK
ncbi:MAG: hypothetical protein R6V77_07605, partial [Candidatus Cloacimonadaceae bacterium]